MRNVMKVSFGIPAYNEQKNIANLLKDILGQIQDGWSLEEIIVIDDASSDHTAGVLNKHHSKSLKVIHHSTRTGKTTAFKEMLSAFRGDILIQFDADERLGGKHVVDKIVKRFNDRPNAMLISGNKRPHKPHSFFQRGLYSTYKVFHESKLKLNAGNNIFGCQGGCIAIRKELARKVHLKDVISEDAFLYLECKKRGFDFEYVDEANVYYKLASNLRDYLSQFFRSTPESVDIFLRNCFGNLAKEEFHRPLVFYFAAVVGVILDDPLPTIYIILINLLAKPLIPYMTRRYKGYWTIASSTK